MSWCGGRIWAISIAVMPSDQTSARASYGAAPSITSGAIQCGVPMTVGARDAVASLSARDAKVGELDGRRRREQDVGGLDVAVDHDALLRGGGAASTSASRHTWAIAPSSKGWPIERIVSRTEPRSQYSITIHSSFGFGNEPWARTMYGESHRCSSFSSFFSSSRHLVRRPRQHHRDVAEPEPRRRRAVHHPVRPLAEQLVQRHVERRQPVAPRLALRLARRRRLATGRLRRLAPAADARRRSRDVALESEGAACAGA